MASQRVALKEAIAEVLSCSLQGDNEIQRLTEERKRALEMTEDYPFILLEIISSDEEALPERVLAAVFLKNYLEDLYLQKHQELIIQRDPNMLGRLTTGLVDVLNIEEPTMKNMISISLTYLVYKGYWPSVNNRIMSFLLSESEKQIMSALIFLDDIAEPVFVVDVEHPESTVHYFQIPAEYFEVLFNIFNQANNFPSKVRKGTVLPMLYIILHSMEDSPSLSDAASRLGQCFQTCLNEPYSDKVDYALKVQVIRGIILAFSLNGSAASRIIVPCLPAVGQLFTSCCQEYKQMIMGLKSMPVDTNEDVENPENFENLIGYMHMLIGCVVKCDIYSSMLMHGLQDLLYCLYVFMSYGNYDTDTEIFPEFTEKDPILGIRKNASSTLTTILIRFRGSKLFFESLHNVYQKHITECDSERNAIYTLRMTESLMFGLGLIREFIPDHTLPSVEDVFPQRYYLENWSLLIQNDCNILLLGRILWLGSKYTGYLQPITLIMHLKACIQNLQDDVKYLRLPCSEALNNHLAAFKTAPMENRLVISDLANDLALCLLKSCEKSMDQPSNYLLAMGNLFKSHPDTCVIYLHNVQELLINLIIMHFSHIKIFYHLRFVLECIAMHQNCKETLEASMVPFILKLIYKNVPEKLMDCNDAPEKGFDLLSTVVLYLPSPLMNIYSFQSFKAGCEIVMNNINHDSNLCESAVSFLTTMMMKYSDQVKLLKDEHERRSLIDYIPKVIFQSLDSSQNTWSNRAGKLCIVSLMTVPQELEPHMENILKSLLSTIHVNEKVEKLKTLWLIFICILMYRPASTINSLSCIPGPEGGSALAYLFNKWKSDYLLDCGRFERTIIAVSLTNLITYAMDDNSGKINEVQVFQKNRKTLSGIEFLYCVLIEVFLFEDDITIKPDELPTLERYLMGDFYDEITNEEEYLFKCCPLRDVDIIDHIKSFLKNCNQFYLNVVREVLTEKEVAHLSSLGVMPDLSME